MDQSQNQHRRIGEYAIDTRQLELCYMTNMQKNIFNYLMVVAIFWCIASFVFIEAVVDSEVIATFPLLLAFSAVI
jgi:hypothetical protein